MLVLSHHLVQIRLCPDETLIDMGEVIGGAAIHEEAATGCSKVISRGAMDGPGIRQMLVGGEYFFHHQI